MTRFTARACLLLSLYLAAIARIPAATPPPGVASPATWPDHGPYQKVGRGENVSGLGVVKMPVPLVAAIRRIIPDDPTQWEFFDGLRDFAGHGWRIMQVCGERGYLTLLVARGSWTILGEPASLPVLNECLDPLVPADLYDQKKTAPYFWHIVLLQKHSQGLFLDSVFRRQHTDRIRKLWTDGTKTQLQDMLALCHDPVITRSGDDLTVRLNFITAHGAVERWTFYLRLGKAVQLKGTTVRQLRKEGTFSYPLI